MTDQLEVNTGGIVTVKDADPVVIPPRPIDKIAAALAKAQAEIQQPKRSREVEVSGKTNAGKAYKYKFKYAPLDVVIEAVRKPLTENGLWFIQTLEDSGTGKYRLLTLLLHESGQFIESRAPLLVEGEGNQRFASALSYMRRYSLISILGLSAEDDDDANIADRNVVRTPKSEMPTSGKYNKTKAKESMQGLSEMIHSDEETPDEFTLDAHLNDHGDLIDQVRRDWPDWLEGIEGNLDFVGFDQRVLDRRIALQEREAIKGAAQ